MQINWKHYLKLDQNICELTLIRRFFVFKKIIFFKENHSDVHNKALITFVIIFSDQHGIPKGFLGLVNNWKVKL